MKNDNDINQSCSNCGTSMQTEANFCSSCGSKSNSKEEEINSNSTTDEFTKMPPIRKDRENFVNVWSKIRIVAALIISIALTVLVGIDRYKHAEKISLKQNRTTLSSEAISKVTLNTGLALLLWSGLCIPLLGRRKRLKHIYSLYDRIRELIFKKENDLINDSEYREELDSLINNLDKNRLTAKEAEDDMSIILLPLKKAGYITKEDINRIEKTLKLSA